MAPRMLGTPTTAQVVENGAWFLDWRGMSLEEADGTCVDLPALGG